MEDPNIFPEEPAEPYVEGPAGDSELEFEEPITELEQVTMERDANLERLQRAQAEFENVKKRLQSQQLESTQRANENFVAKLLPVLDTIDLAKAHEPSGSLEQISTSLLEVLTKEGLERIPAVGVSFDPNEHDAVAHEDGEGGPTVSEELRAGYKWKGRVLRPAMVKVVG